MMTEFGMDGLYLDEIAYDRVTLLRARKMLGAHGLVDHHSDAGAFCVSPALNYMELFPFIDRLWYGEGFNYDAATFDYWLVEMSGLAFGLTADMLRYDGMTAYPYRGMLVASSNRWQSALDPGESSPFDPTGLWALWADFGIAEATMYGWWMDVEEGVGSAPVWTSHPQVKATAYVKVGTATLVALASFASAAVDVTLGYDWTVLGLPAAQSQLVAPVIQPFQPTGGTYGTSASFTVPAGQGWIFRIEAK